MSLQNVLAISSLMSLGMASLATVIHFFQREANYTEYEYLQQQEDPESFRPNYNRVTWNGPIGEDRCVRF